MLRWTSVEITVENLDMAESLNCRFGKNGTIASALSVGRNTISCLTPPWLISDHVQIEVSSNGRDFTSSRHTFHFQEEAEIFAVSPIFGSTLGGDLINVYGKNFVDSKDLFCAFGKIVPKLWKRRGMRPEVQCSYVSTNQQATFNTTSVCDSDKAQALGNPLVSKFRGQWYGSR